ncbi:porin [Halomonas saccharevitans]|uniref:Porin n=1 Tax=Halomonas saccharevitans TaxID=416872 RepID=A0ABU3NF17_9GAMM|nr:porin [Halomonas saccharevitans]MDT8879779.1 porin [Halomonas saccharevitans]
MKKTLLATAIAGALAASGAQAATVYNQDGTKLDLYGNLQLAYANTNDASGESTDELADNGSTLGVAGEHVIYDGLTGYFKYEFEGDADEIKGAGGLDTGDQAYFGLKGNFGDARIGSWDPLIDDWIQDPITNNEYFDVTDSNSGILNVGTADREGDKLQFMSPSFSGFQFAVGTQFKGDAEENTFTGTLDGVDSFFAEDEQFGDDTKHTVEADSNASFFGGVKYTAGAFSIAAAYDDLGNYDGTITNISGTTVDANGDEVNGNLDEDVSADFDAGDQYGITVQYTIDTLRLSAKIERFESDNDLTVDTNYYALGARYGYGMGDIYGAYQYVDQNADTFSGIAADAIDFDEDVELGDDNYNEFMIGATYNVSDAMYTFVEAAWYDRENDAGDGVAVGAVYLF